MSLRDLALAATIVLATGSQVTAQGSTGSPPPPAAGSATAGGSVASGAAAAPSTMVEKPPETPAGAAAPSVIPGVGTGSGMPADPRTPSRP